MQLHLLADRFAIMSVVSSELLPLFVIQRWLERNEAIDLHDLLGPVRLKEIQPKWCYFLERMCT